jgi:hypothetical protein
MRISRRDHVKRPHGTPSNKVTMRRMILKISKSDTAIELQPRFSIQPTPYPCMSVLNPHTARGQDAPVMKGYLGWEQIDGPHRYNDRMVSISSWVGYVNWPSDVGDITPDPCFTWAMP